MDPWQSYHIQKNLNYLVKNTNCNPTFLAILQERNILSDSDYSRLVAKRKSDGRIAQSKSLFDVLPARRGGFETLVEAFRETAQTGCLHILEQAREEDFYEIQKANRTALIPLDVYSQPYCRENWIREPEPGNYGELEWISSQDVPCRISELIPAGREDCTLYVSRARHEGQWIPGKFLIGSDGIYRCYVPHYEKEHQYRDFQVLMAPPGATAWVETCPKNIPRNAVVAGIDPANSEPTYVCRAWHDGKLIVGKALASYEYCFIPYFGKELWLRTRFEVLVYNEQYRITELSKGISNQLSLD